MSHLYLAHLSHLYIAVIQLDRVIYLMEPSPATAKVSLRVYRNDFNPIASIILCDIQRLVSMYHHVIELHRFVLDDKSDRHRD